MLKRVNKEQICCPVVFFEEIWGGKYPAGPRASCLKNFMQTLFHPSKKSKKWLSILNVDLKVEEFPIIKKITLSVLA